MATAEQIRSYIERTHGKQVGNDESLLDSGILDSVAIFELVSFLEDTFGIKIDDEAIIPENFETVALVAAFVDRTRAAA